MANLADVSSIDGNVWYAITETRVNWTSSMQYDGHGLVFSGDNNVAKQMWQFFKLENGNWAIRSQATGINKQLSTCYVASEKADSKVRMILTFFV
jgi:hypothetical protein